MDKIDSINTLINRQYRDRKYSELQALSKLFSVKYLEDLEAVLNKGLINGPGYKERVNVSVGWIDKIPLASFVDRVRDHNGNVIKKKVELGDFLVVSSRTVVFPRDGKPVFRNLERYAMIIQAKLSKTRHPKVPIGTMNKARVNSTSKELALLSSWPPFDLFKTANSKSRLLSNVRLDVSESNRKFCGYFHRQWDLGNPQFGVECKESMGQLIVEMIQNNEGQAFKVDGEDHWSKLINTLIELCGAYDLPGYIFGKQPGKRYVFTNMLFCNPIMAFFLFPRRKRFPILFINRIDYEGDWE